MIKLSKKNWASDDWKGVSFYFLFYVAVLFSCIWYPSYHFRMGTSRSKSSSWPYRWRHAVRWTRNSIVSHILSLPVNRRHRTYIRKASRKKVLGSIVVLSSWKVVWKLRKIFEARFHNWVSVAWRQSARLRSQRSQVRFPDEQAGFFSFGRGNQQSCDSDSAEGRHPVMSRSE